MITMWPRGLVMDAFDRGSRMKPFCISTLAFNKLGAFSSTTSSYNRSQCTGTTAHMGQATPASRCEPTFRSSETPALLVPKQRPCVCRATSVRSGTALKMSIPPITNQSPITDHHALESPPLNGPPYILIHYGVEAPSLWLSPPA